MKRREFLLSASLAALSGPVTAAQKATPSQTAGPFYPPGFIPLDNDLVHHAGGVALGDHLDLYGAALTTDGIPLSGAVIEIWQCDANSSYRHPRSPNKHLADKHFAGFGATRLSADGAYMFRTIVPVPYSVRPPHIHVRIKHRDRPVLTTQLYLKGRETENELLGFSRAGRSELLIDPVREPAGGWRARFDFVVDAV